MKITATKQRTSADVLIIPFWEENNKAQAAHAGSIGKEFLQAPLLQKDFTGKKNETCLLYPQKQKEKRFILLGLGKKEDVQLEDLRRCYGEALKISVKKKAQSVSLIFPEALKEFSKESIVLACCEGALLANYSFDKYQKEKASVVQKLFLVGCTAKEEKIASHLPLVVDSVCMVRNLVSDNADVVTPQKLAEVALDLQKISSNLKVRVYNKKEIENMKMGLLLAVNQGAKSDPVFIEISFRNNTHSKEHTVLVGKGITFDSGGLDLKPADSMETMKDDMAGAAAVLGVMRSLALLDKKVNVTALIPSTENAIGSRSYKPGDVFTSMSGKTVEIANTDAEGRLILADALHYAAERIQPTRIIDLATLTGAIVVALGEEMAGVFSNHDKLAQIIFEAGQKTGEMTWKMPLIKEYLELFKSDIADMKNCGPRPGGSITAALFLSQYVKNIPWAHIDIAGVAFWKKAKGYIPMQGTGFGVRLILEVLEALSQTK